MSALPPSGRRAVRLECLLSARSRHASFRWSFLLSAIGGHSADPSTASGTLSRSHEIEVAIDQNVTRHLLGTETNAISAFTPLLKKFPFLREVDAKHWDSILTI